MVLQNAIRVSGIGLHSGEPSSVTLHPADPGTGYQFRVGDVTIPALHNFVVDTRRCTVLGKDGARVSTVEHLLSALMGLQVQDCLIEVHSGHELPIGDGSALIWTNALQEAGLCGEPSGRTPVERHGHVFAASEGGPAYNAWVATDAKPARIVVVVGWENHPLAPRFQRARFSAPMAAAEYLREIAPARTFGFVEEIEALRAAGLAKGGNAENAIVIHPDRYEPALRFSNELARHKLLDFIGDLALAGVGFPNARITAFRPGHRMNVEFAAALRGHVNAINCRMANADDSQIVPFAPKLANAVQ